MSLARGLGDAGAMEMAVYLRSEPASSHQIAAIGFHHNAIGPRGCEALAEALEGLPALDELAIYSNNIGAAGAAVGPGWYRSPRHRMPFKCMNEGSKCV